jgi:tetratricopeptide (TPR) repeat protein
MRAADNKLEEASAGPFVISSNQVKTLDLILQVQYFDQPQFTVAGVTDNTYRGGHGADTVLRSSETLTKQTAALTSPSAAERDGQPLQAVEQLQRAAEANPSEPNLFDWGTELLAHRAPEAAAQVFGKGVRLFPGSTRMLLGLASAQYSAGAYEQSAEAFFKATDLNPADVTPYLFLAEVQRREITDLPGYEDRMARFAKLHPENASANYDYAVALWNRHDAARAVELLERTEALDPHFARADLQLGIVYAAEQKYDQAIDQLRKAEAADPNLEETHYRLAEAYRVTGKRTEAAEELARYTQLSQQSAEQRERQRRQLQQFVVLLKSQ